VSGWGHLKERAAEKWPLVTVRGVEHGGAPWIELAIEVGLVEDCNLHTLLLHNFDLVIGQIRAIDGRLVLWQTLPLEGLLDENFDDVAHSIVEGRRIARDYFAVRK
jgi:hypothetical protein